MYHVFISGLWGSASAAESLLEGKVWLDGGPQGKELEGCPVVPFLVPPFLCFLVTATGAAVLQTGFCPEPADPKYNCESKYISFVFKMWVSEICPSKEESY